MRVALSQGSPVEIVHLATRERGEVEAVEDSGHTVVVVTESGDVLVFHLFASGHFFTHDRACRLVPSITPP